MSTLSSLKKSFGITDDSQVEYEKIDNELILHIPLQSSYSKNSEIINKAQNLVQQRKQNGWNRDDFFEDFMRVIRKKFENVIASEAKQSGCRLTCCF